MDMRAKGLRFPKGEARTTTKGRARRRARAVVRDVRDDCVARDGYCRVEGYGLGDCDGPSEWAHLGAQKRFKTRGQDPEERHTTAGSCIFCRSHHHAYDKGTGDDRLAIEALTPRGAEGRLAFTRGGRRYEEAVDPSW